MKLDFKKGDLITINKRPEFADAKYNGLTGKVIKRIIANKSPDVFYEVRLTKKVPGDFISGRLILCNAHYNELIIQS